MATRIVIDPVTRLEGHLAIEVEVDVVQGVQQVIDARASGTLFRGFEKLLVGRHPWDAQHITQRICGVCPTPHGLAAVLGLEKAYRVAPPKNALLMRNIVLGANFVQSHILHFYHLALLDFVRGADMPPWKGGYGTDIRINGAKASALFAHYVKALEMTRKAQEAGAIYGGRLPMSPAFIPGGFTKNPEQADVDRFKSYLAEIVAFVQDAYLPDAQYVASVYDDYLEIGGGYANLLAFGVFDLDAGGTRKLLKRGHVTAGAETVEPLSLGDITEEVTYSWYADSSGRRNPSVGVTLPQFPKEGAYSWLKSPRYKEVPYETGALARMWVNGDYRRGISAMDRSLARAREALKIAKAMLGWVDRLETGGPVFTEHNTLLNADAVGRGLTEAPRGALGHWIMIRDNKIGRYQIITPTCWNASPRDGQGIRGPIEQALIGTPVQNMNEPIEVLRVIHSFDPCLSCAVHIVNVDRKKAFRV